MNVNKLSFVLLFLSMFFVLGGCKSNNLEWRLLVKGNYSDYLISPNKEKALYLKTFRGPEVENKATDINYQLWYLDLLSKKRYLLSSKNVSKLYAWHPSNNQVSVLFDANLISFNIKTRKSHFNRLNFLNNSNSYQDLTWSNSGKKLSIVADYGKFRSVPIIYDIRRKKTELISTKDGDYIRTAIWSKDDKKLGLSIQDTESEYSRKNEVSDIYAPTSLFIKNINGKLIKIIDNKKGDSSYYPIDWSPDNEWILVKYSFPDYLRLKDQSVKNQFFYNLKNKKFYKLMLPSKFANGKFIGWNQKDSNSLYLVTKKGLWLLDFKRIAKKQINQKMIENMKPFSVGDREP